MQVYTSRPIELKKDINTLYDMISSPGKLQPLLEKFGDKVEKFKVQVSEDQLSLFVPAMGEVILKRTEALPPHSVKYESTKSPIPIALQFNLSENGESATLGQVAVHVNVPPFLSGVAKSKVEPALVKVADLLEKVDLDKWLK